MKRRSTAHLMKLVVAFVVAAGMLLSAAHVTTSHNPAALVQAEAERHAQLAVEVADHGHSHFDGEEAERLPGHVHGHNSADHIHDPAMIVPVPGLRQRAPVRVTMPAIQEGATLGLQHGLDRPPRRLVT
jgi:hypothetical protein